MNQLITAAERGDTPAVLRLLAEGAPLNERDARGRTALMAATHGNQVETFQVLLDAGADVNLQDDLQDNPFLYAGAEGLLDILKLAYAAGADTTLTNRYGGSALIPAAHRGHVEVVREILEHTDVNIDHINRLGWTALMEAIVLSDGGPRHQQIVQLLVDHGADVTIPDKDGLTPLQQAQNRNFIVIAEILRQAGA
jgi:ankyrin repeat protein